MNKKVVSLILAMLLLSSCSAVQPEPNQETQINDNIREKVEVNTMGLSNILKVSAAEPEKVELDNVFINQLGNFSEKLFVNVSERYSDNLIFSPLSVMYVLSLCANGADGKTLEEFQDVLGETDIELLNNCLYTLTGILSQSKESTFKSANSVWCNNEYVEINPEFSSIADRYYTALAADRNFSDPSTLPEINDWVKENTDGMIPQALDYLDPALKMLLMNTVLFDGVWENEYAETDITDGFFTNYDGSRSDVKYMKSTEYSYFNVDGGVGFTKAYKDGYRFTAVLPSGDIKEFVQNLDVDKIMDAADAGTEKVVVTIPKFEYESYIGLSDVLKSLGLNSAFDETAELGGLQANGENDILISNIFQKAKIINNEHGTKSAAVTGIMFATTALIHEVREIHLDKPFIYMITNEDGAILFMGNVMNINE